METSLKTGFAQISLAAQKILVAQTLGGAAAPLAPPARTPMLTRLEKRARKRDQTATSNGNNANGNKKLSDTVSLRHRALGEVTVILVLRLILFFSRPHKKQR